MKLERFFYIKSNSWRNRIRELIEGQRYLPRWVVLCLDLILSLLAVSFTVIVMLTSPYIPYLTLTMWERIGIVLGLQILSFGIFKTYAGIIRHSTFVDVYRIALSVLFVLIGGVVINYIYYWITDEKIFLIIELLLYTIFSALLLISFRIIVKESYHFILNAASGKFKKVVLVFGVDDRTIGLTQSIIANTESKFKPVAFLSDSKSGKNYKVIGLPFLSSSENLNDDLEKYKGIFNLDGILMVADQVTIKDKNYIVESALNNGLEVFNISLPKELSSSETRVNITPIQIEDLLERNEIEVDNKLISEDLQGRTILITGGAGSIGSELARLIAGFEPKKLIVLDNAESMLHEIDLFLKNTFPNLNYQVYLADITKVDRMDGIFKKFKFDIVYHAAAYKHVPMIERHPREGIRTNTIGTRIIAELAAKYKCDRFVMVSTDKAVNPSNVMGASKRAAEMFVQAFQKRPDMQTKFITTRFGNVLGSNGSVIPLFKKQIERGGPVTVTHEEIIRYFMTIREACQLVLQAGTMGKGGEIFVFDMGKPVRILDMAERMIKLCGLQPYKDINIEITGLREGEKLFEELLIDGETALPTYHPKILVSKMVDYDCQTMINALDKIEQMINKGEDNVAIIQKLKILVPEFVSQNSVYNSLDHQSQ